MRYGVSHSQDYKQVGEVVIRDFLSEPKGRVLCVIARDNKYEAEQTAQYICDQLNKAEQAS
jgi:hypothetical protein